jgi:hypothetical protein
MARAPRPRTSQPSSPSRRSRSTRAAESDALAFENAIQEALRDALEEPVSEMAESLARIADRLAGGSALLSLGWGEPEEEPAAEQAPEEAGPPPRPCAVIGCQNPVRSLGYCAAHYQKRRLMIASNRLHPLWVENAEPHSLPDVIPPRRPRGERQRTESPAPEAAPEVRPVAEPRVIIRKKGQTGAASGTPEKDAAPTQSEHEQVASTVERWAQEFKARGRS